MGPENAGYYGACSLDAVYMLLLCLFRNNTLRDCMNFALTLREDSDSICAIVGYIAPLFYGNA